MIKTFLDELHADMPEGLAAYLETPFGEVADIAMPNSKDAAVIACGQLAANLNNAFLKPFAGMTPVEMILRAGQKNPVFISSLLGSLEFITGGGGGLQIIAPAEGSVNPNYFELACACPGKPVTVSVTVGEMVIDLTRKTGNTWKGFPATPIPSGKHLAEFLAEFDDGSTLVKTSNFETTANMELVATFPENDTSYRAKEITQVSATLSDDAAASTDSLTASVFGQVYTLAKSGATYAAEVWEIYIDFVGMNVMTVKNLAGDILGEVNFIITGEEGGD